MLQDVIANLPMRLRLRVKLDEAKERTAVRATLTAAHLLGLAAGRRLRQLRSTDDRVLDVKARLDEAQLQGRLAWEVVEILSSRLAKIPEGRRPYYSPSRGFRILEIRNLLGWSRDVAARVFLVSPNTITNWDQDADPVSQTVGSTVKPSPPVTLFADSVRSLLQLMTRLGFGGHDLVALTLARAGWRITPRTVGRVAREKPKAVPLASLMLAKTSHPVVARFAHHVWMMDVTEIQGFLGGNFHLAGVFDAFSRVPLAVQIFERKPRASDMARLFKCHRTSKSGQ